jgi:tRNA (guanine-N7-)-methyltransferase
VDNPARTAEYIARSKASQAALKRTLAELLAAHTRLTLELGAGHGHFLTDYAAAHPAEFCLGIDLQRDRVSRAERKCKRAGLTNLAFLQAEALESIAQLPAHAKAQKIFILFPDPWPKRRHHKNRLIQSAFLSELAKRTSSNAQLYFRTDDTSYFTAAHAVVQKHRDWLIVSKPWPYERETVFQSRAPAYQSLVAVRS